MTQIAPTTTFAVADPRGFDGNPYEVAYRAVSQAAGLCRVQIKATTDARIMARNAEMTRQEAIGQPMSAVAFENGPVARKFDAILGQLGEQLKTLEQLAQAAGFDPKAPLGK